MRNKIDKYELNDTYKVSFILNVTTCAAELKPHVINELDCSSFTISLNKWIILIT